MLGYDSLANFFKTNFTLMHEHKYVLRDIENMMVWEKLLYVDILKQYIKNLEDLRRDRAAQQRSKRVKR